eukprot:g3687.t1
MFVLLSANITLSDSCEAEISECNRERACLLLSDHADCTQVKIFAAHCGSNPLGSFRLLSRYTTPATEDARTHAPPRDFATELEGAVFLRDEEPDDLDHEGHDEVDEKEVCVDFAAALSAWFGDGKLDAAIQHRIGSREADSDLLQDECLPSTSEPEEEEFLRFSTQTHLEHLPEALRYCGSGSSTTSWSSCAPDYGLVVGVEDAISVTTRQQEQLFLKSIRQRVRGCFFRLLDVVSLSGAAEDVQQKTTPPTNYTLTSQLQLNLPTLLAQLAREQKKREHVAQESCDRAKREEDQWRRLGMKKIAISLGRSHAHWLHGVKNTAAGVLVDPSSFDLGGNQTNIDVEQGPLDRDPNQKTTIRIPFSKLEKSHAALWNERASNV